MDAAPQVSEFGRALLFLIGGLVLMGAGLLTNRLLAPNRPSPEKLSTYECGEDALGSSWVQFNMRFYSMGLIFLVFDVEVLLLFPWATVFADPRLMQAVPGWGWLSLVEAGVFVGVLLLGLAYIWAKGDIDWIRPQPIVPSTGAAVPEALYAAFNRQALASRPATAAEVEPFGVNT